MATVTTYEEWSLIAAFTSVLVNLVLFRVFAGQLRELRHQTSNAQNESVRDHDRRRKQASIEFYATTLEARERFKHELPEDRDAQAIRTLISTPDAHQGETFHVLREYLSLFELLATGVNSEVFDVNVMTDIAGGRLLAIRDNYWPWIEERKRITESPLLYSEFDSMCQSIRSIRDTKLARLAAAPEPQVA